jgi:N-acetylneuraminic acid mutarotase
LNATTASTTSSAATLSVVTEPAAASLSGEDAVLPGSTGHVISTAEQTQTTYEWAITNGSITAGQGQRQITYSAGNAGKTTLVLTVSNVAGKRVAIKDVVVTPSLPIATIFAQPTVHPGSSNLLAAAPSIGGQTYTWSVHPNTASATINGSTASTALSYDVGTTPGLYSLAMTSVDQAGRTTSIVRSLAVSEDVFLLDPRDPTPRSLHTATTLNDGTVLVVGGDAGVPDYGTLVPKPGSQSRILSNTELFNPETRTWARLADSLVPRMGHSATMLDDGRVLAVGGAISPVAVSTVTDIYDAVTRSWTSADPLTQARAFHTATLLADGRVLVVGGADTNTALASAEIYDPQNGTWTIAASMSVGRVLHSATRMQDGRVLVAGGRNDSGGLLASAEIYDPASNAWQPAAAMPASRNAVGAVLLPSGDILVLGSSSLLYKVATDTWSPSVADPRKPLQGATATTAILLPDGRVLAAGSFFHRNSYELSLYDPIKREWSSLAVRQGSYSTATALRDGTILELGGIGLATEFVIPQNFQSLARANLFNPALGSSTTLGSGAHSGADAAIARLSDGRLLATGGDTSRIATALRATATSHVFDPNSNQWNATASMSTARTAHTATTLPANQVLVAGGNNSLLGVFATAERYDAGANSWTPAGSMSTPRYRHTATALNDGRVLVAGGSDRNSSCSCTTFQSSVDIYAPVTNSWTAAASLQTARFDHTATRLGDGRILVVGGFGGTPDALNPGGSALASAEIYDPGTGTWSAAASMSAARTGHTATILNTGRVLIAGGTSGAGTLSSAEIYDPVTNTWSAAAPMNFARQNHKALSLPDTRILVVGGLSSSTNAVFGVESGEVYDPVTNSWTATLRAVPRQRFSAELLPNGRVLIVGGAPNAAGLPEFFD